MFRMYMFVGKMFLATAFFFSVSSIRADMLVEHIHGPASAIQVYKNNKQVTVIRLSVMTGGEVINIETDHAAIALIAEDGKTVRVDKSNSPYTVEKSKSKGWMDNAVLAALKWYNNLDKETALPVSTVTRGVYIPPVNLLGMYGTENLVPSDLGELQFFWAGGKAPYQVKLVTDNGKELMNQEVDMKHVTYSGEGLAIGGLLFVIENTVKAKKQMEKQTFQVVSPEFLPESVNDVLKISLPKSVKQSLAAMMLAKYPKWRFAALQYAVASKEERLVKMLLWNDFASGH